MVLLKESKETRGSIGVISVVGYLPSMRRTLKWVWRHAEEGNTKEGGLKIDEK